MSPGWDGAWEGISNILESQAPVLPISRLAREREDVSRVLHHHSHVDEFVESHVTACSHTHNLVVVSRRVMEAGAGVGVGAGVSNGPARHCHCMQEGGIRAPSPIRAQGGW